LFIGSKSGRDKVHRKKTDRRHSAEKKMNVENEYVDGDLFHREPNKVYNGEYRWAVTRLAA
jgi:hypothetical protein